MRMTNNIPVNLPEMQVHTFLVLHSATLQAHCSLGLAATWIIPAGT